MTGRPPRPDDDPADDQLTRALRQRLEQTAGDLADDSGEPPTEAELKARAEAASQLLLADLVRELQRAAPEDAARLEALLQVGTAKRAGEDLTSPAPGEPAVAVDPDELLRAAGSLVGELGQLVSRRLNEQLGLPLNAGGYLDEGALSERTIITQASERLRGLVGASLLQAEEAPPGEAPHPEPAAPAPARLPNRARPPYGVLDRIAARRRHGRRHRPPPFEMGRTLHETLERFIASQVVPQALRRGPVALQLDADFFRRHGAALWRQVWEELLAPALVPVTTFELGSRETGDAADTAAQPGDDGEVRVHLDLASLMAEIFRRLGPGTL